jgi:transcriptional regulator NrdR family protein
MPTAQYKCPECSDGYLRCIDSRRVDDGEHPIESARTQTWYCTNMECRARFINHIPKGKLVKVSGKVNESWIRKYLQKKGILPTHS